MKYRNALKNALDSMIEATALHWDLTVVTRNTGDFVEVPTLDPYL